MSFCTHTTATSEPALTIEVIHNPSAPNLSLLKARFAYFLNGSSLTRFTSSNIKNAILNDEGHLLNDEGRLSNDEGRLSNYESRLLNDESWLLNDEGRLLNDESRLLNDEARLLNDESRLLNDENRLSTIKAFQPHQITRQSSKFIHKP